ncbi:glycine--tRNA ligase subunit beta [Candidatus Pelagibacter sp. HIMB1321]|uniref:glycine--tRNA ligase subunit beta n=1 Tax=Candidatus Pelagibacter sp. HIMB1321 TaxID=1388755 RepID=UPI000A080BB0|nr:glycine--tRNA ligase subunit beta [Candidatus Pelagibacter sp. HIMB1321]SMF79001.1 glycyl-tRNA synthetase beta chain [Candidatus Pelagibacter sp. HIMB1321]
MSELFLELFSEEIPVSLQKDIREKLILDIKKVFEEKSIKFKKYFSLSTPNRLVVVFQNLDREVKIKSEEIKGPSTTSPPQALEGFLKSQKISKKQVFKKKNDKGEFYFYKTKEAKLKTLDLIKQRLPKILIEFKWKKSMKWGSYNLNWGRPLKSILCVFDKKVINFSIGHLKSSNYTFLDKDFEERKKTFNDFNIYQKSLEQTGTIIDQDKRKDHIRNEIEKILKKKNLIIDENEKLLDEVNNLVDQPHIIECSFDKKFLTIPQEILVLTMQSHQKYFPLFTKKKEITNEFIVVANKKDNKGLIKIGNERVVKARLEDAEFFWNKDKSQNLVKKVSGLKNMNFFKGLGTYFDKVQRMRKLAAMISDELLISKEKVELSATICKTDLISEIVSEFPELQGIMGGHISHFQGFDKEISEAVKEQYLPTGPHSNVSKKPYSITLSLSDRIDTLVGFFGINEKPSSSKDPYALRRVAYGIIRMIIENKKDIKINDIISYSLNIYLDQDFKFSNNNIIKDISFFLKDRFKYYLKDKNFRPDIVDAAVKILDLNKISTTYEKAKSLNKIIEKPLGMDVVSSYRRAFNIINSETKKAGENLTNTTDPGIFNNEYEKALFKKTNELKQHFAMVENKQNFDEILSSLASAKKEIFDFFDNVKVNDESEIIKKNRLELLSFFCKTYENFIDFQLIKDANE